MKTFRISTITALAAFLVLAWGSFALAEGPNCASKDNAQCKAACEKMKTDGKCTMTKGDACCAPEKCAQSDCMKGSQKCTMGSAACSQMGKCDKMGKQCKPGEACKPAPSDGKEKS